MCSLFNFHFMCQRPKRKKSVISFLNHRHRNIQMQTQHDSVAIQALIHYHT